MYVKWRWDGQLANRPNAHMRVVYVVVLVFWLFWLYLAVFAVLLAAQLAAALARINCCRF